MERQASGPRWSTPPPVLSCKLHTRPAEHRPSLVVIPDQGVRWVQRGRVAGPWRGGAGMWRGRLTGTMTQQKVVMPKGSWGARRGGSARAPGPHRAQRGVNHLVVSDREKSERDTQAEVSSSRVRLPIAAGRLATATPAPPTTIAAASTP